VIAAAQRSLNGALAWSIYVRRHNTNQSSEGEGRTCSLEHMAQLPVVGKLQQVGCTYMNVGSFTGGKALLCSPHGPLWATDNLCPILSQAGQRGQVIRPRRWGIPKEVGPTSMARALQRSNTTGAHAASRRQEVSFLPPKRRKEQGGKAKCH